MVATFSSFISHSTQVPDHPTFHHNSPLPHHTNSPNRKCVMKDGVLTVNGKEYVFHKATGEYEWQTPRTSGFLSIARPRSRESAWVYTVFRAFSCSLAELQQNTSICLSILHFPLVL